MSTTVRLKTQFNCLIVVLILQLFSIQGLAQELPAQVMQNAFIPNSIALQITPKGLSYFEDNLLFVLEQQGSVKIESNQFDQRQFQSPKFSYDDFVKGSEDNQKKLKSVRDFIGQWASGLSISNEHQFILELGKFKYKAEFKKFSLITNESMLESIGKKSGAVLALELEASQINFNAESFKLYDQLAQNLVPEINLQNTQLTLKPNQPEQIIKLKIPFYIDVDETTHVIKIEILKIEENLKDIIIDFDFKKLITSKYEITIKKIDDGGSKVSLTTFNIDLNQLGATFQNNKKTILGDLKLQLSKFINQKLPDLINQKAADFLKNRTTFTHIIPMIDPHANASPLESTPTPLFMGHEVNRIVQNAGGILIQLSSFISDPLFPTSIADTDSFMKQWPQLDNNLNENDAVMVLNQGVLQRVIQHNFNRGYLTHLNSESCTGSKTQISFLEVPKISASKITSQDPTETFLSAKVKLALKVPKSAEFVTVNGSVVFEAEVNLKIKSTPLRKTIKIYKDNALIDKTIEDATESRLDIYLDFIDPKTVVIDKKSLGKSGQLTNFLGVVDFFKNKAIANINTPDLKCGPVKPILSQIPLPPSFYGLKFKINKINYDPAGSFMLYLNINRGL